MSTQRYISTSFWDDEWIHKLDPSEKLLYLYFMTNPLTTIAGIYKLSESRICFDTGFNENTIRHIMSKFELAKKAYRFNEWIIIPNWSKHQKVKERDNIRKGIDRLLLSLPDDVFNYSVSKGYKYIYLNELGRPLQGSSEPFDYLDSDIDKDSDMEVPEVQEPAIISKPKKQKPDKGEYKPYGEYGNVFFYDCEYESLVKKEGQEVIDKAIEIVDLYLYNTPNKHYTDFVKVFNTWALEDARKRLMQEAYSKPLTPKVSIAPPPKITCCGEEYSWDLGFCKQCGKTYKRDGTPV